MVKEHESAWLDAPRGSLGIALPPLVRCVSCHERLAYFLPRAHDEGASVLSVQSSLVGVALAVELLRDARLFEAHWREAMARPFGGVYELTWVEHEGERLPLCTQTDGAREWRTLFQRVGPLVLQWAAWEHARSAPAMRAEELLEALWRGARWREEGAGAP